MKNTTNFVCVCFPVDSRNYSSTTTTTTTRFCFVFFFFFSLIPYVRFDDNCYCLSALSTYLFRVHKVETLMHFYDDYAQSIYGACLPVFCSFDVGFFRLTICICIALRAFARYFYLKFFSFFFVVCRVYEKKKKLKKQPRASTRFETVVVLTKTYIII